MEKPETIDAYIAGFPEDIQQMLQAIRETVQKAAPEAEETIKYDMPTYVLNGNLVFFAAFKKHIGFYGVPTGNAAFPELSAYKEGKGSVQFPFDQPMPLELIEKIVKYRVKKNSQASK